MIPKKIHYCWFGNNPKPPIAEFCIQSWKKFNPDFEIIEWNENNFDINLNPFTQEAYNKKKWAFVADVARVYALFNHGGFYLDTDMEMRGPLSDFTHESAICGFEIKNLPYSAFWAIEKGHILGEKMLAHYNESKFEEIPNTHVFSKLLVDEFGADPEKDIFQKLKYNVSLYPSNYFSLDLPLNYVTHHFSGSWHDSWTAQENHYKEMVNMYGILNMLLNQKKSKKKITNVVFNHKVLNIDDVLDQIPTRYIFNYMKKKFKKRIGL